MENMNVNKDDLNNGFEINTDHMHLTINNHKHNHFYGNPNANNSQRLPDLNENNNGLGKAVAIALGGIGLVGIGSLLIKDSAKEVARISSKNEQKRIAQQEREENSISTITYIKGPDNIEYGYVELVTKDDIELHKEAICMAPLLVMRVPKQAKECLYISMPFFHKKIMESGDNVDTIKINIEEIGDNNVLKNIIIDKLKFDGTTFLVEESDAEVDADGNIIDYNYTSKFGFRDGSRQTHKKPNSYYLAFKDNILYVSKQKITGL